MNHMKLYKREKYLKKIRGFYHDTDIIKVISGVRRCGKSCLMQMIADELIAEGIPEENICFYNLDKYGYKSIRTADDLEKLLFHKSYPSGTKYIFIDEIQNVDGFETVINELREEGEYSIFITGSNSYLLSGELVTKLTGRYVEFEIFTLTFDEYVGMKRMYGKPVSERMEEELDSYILEGGFPRAVQYDSLDDKRTYVKSVIDEIFEKDIKRRVQIRHKDTFNKVQTFILNNFGATMSLNNILDELKKENVNIKRDTLNRYIQVLLDAKIIYECRRFDLKSKKAIRGEKKYYLSDLSFYYINNVDNRINYGPVLENIVYQYARSCNYDVSIGRIGSFECDFIVRDNMMNYAYLQVAMTIMNSRDTEDREYRPLESIKDNYPKYVLTRNDPIQRRNGIIHMNIPKLIINEQRFA